MINKNPTKISLFEGNKIRKTYDRDKWWFSVVDVIFVLTGSQNPQIYWRVFKKRLLDEGSNQTVTNCNGFKMMASDGKMRLTDCADSQTLLRLIQSIPSPKAEPFKLWLAKVGHERIQEIEDPELAVTRAKSIYSQKGYSSEWVEKRMRGIAVRNELTDEWKNRGANEGVEYAILTNEIMQGTFGLNVKNYKKKKNLTTQNLRDHMNDLELIFTMLGEATTTNLTTDKNSVGYHQLKTDAHQAGIATGKARKNIEDTLHKKIVSSTNYLDNKTKKLK